MNDDQLSVYLSNVDEPGDDVPREFRERLWGDLQPVLHRTDTTSVRLADGPLRNRSTPRWLIGVAAAVLIGVVVLWPRSNDSQIEVRESVPSTSSLVDSETSTTVAVTATVAPVSASDACADFLSSSSLLPVGTTPPLTAELVAEFEVHVELLADRLERAPDAPAGVVQPVRIAAASLREASRALDAGDLALADAAVSSAQGFVSSIEADLEAVGIGCFLPR